VKPKGFAMSFIHASVRGHVEQERASRSPCQEFLDYIKSPLEIGEHDPVKWWGVCYLILRNTANVLPLFIASPDTVSNTSPHCS
jgi:hypothetical protein